MLHLAISFAAVVLLVYGKLTLCFHRAGSSLRKASKEAAQYVGAVAILIFGIWTSLYGVILVFDDLIRRWQN